MVQGAAFGMQRSCVRIAPSRQRKEDWPSWLMAPVLKTGRPGRVSWVRILHLPQIGAWCSGSTAVSKTVNESSTLSAPATLGWRSGERIGLQNRHSRVRIPLRAQKLFVYLHPQKPLLDMAQTFIISTCWRRSQGFVGCAMSENENRHQQRFNNFREHRS